MVWRAILQGVIFGGVGVLMVKAALERRAAVSRWRAAVGGDYDKAQRCFVTELELDRRRLPPEAARLLRTSRANYAFGLGLMAFALVLQTMTLGD
ncbi:MAG: hypothetical protein ACOYKM_04535 [Caulobacterales bacterium]|jgi:hypothetical protein